jgi:hypothetical protein
MKSFALAVVVVLLSAVSSSAQTTVPGIYVEQNGSVVHLARAQAKVKGTSFLKRTGLGIVTYGMSEALPERTNQVLEGARASLRLPSAPHFQMVDMDMRTYVPGTIPVMYNPQTYVLVKLDAGKKDRKITIQSLSLVSIQTGVNSKDMVQVNTVQKDGHWNITPTTSLPPGEYAFIPVNGVGAIYDFGVD